MDPVPKKKPITREKFEEKVDLYMQGLFGGMGRELMLPLLNKVYQEAKDAGVVTPEEAYKYAQDKSNYYKDLNMRQQMRAPFAEGGPPKSKLFSLFSKEQINKESLNRYGREFTMLNEAQRGNITRRMIKFIDFFKNKKRFPTEEEARKIGREQKKITDAEISRTKKPLTESQIRERLIKNNKKVFLPRKGKVIFADPNIQNQFENDLLKRYSTAKTSLKAKQMGVLSNKDIYNKYFKNTPISEDSVRTGVFNTKKFLSQDFTPLSPTEKESIKLQRVIDELISHEGKRLQGIEDFPAHHLYPLGDEFVMRGRDVTIIPKTINSRLQNANKNLKQIIRKRTDLVNKISSVEISPTEFEIQNQKLDKQATDVINKHYKKHPEDIGLLNYKKLGLILDDQARFLDVAEKGTIGGDNSRWRLENIDKTLQDKRFKDFSKEELKSYRNILSKTAKLGMAGGNPLRNMSGAETQMPQAGRINYGPDLLPKYLIKESFETGGPVKYGKYAKQISKLSS